MTDSPPITATLEILSALDRDLGGFAIIWSPDDLGLRDDLIEDVEELAFQRPMFRTHSVDQAIEHPHDLVLLIPDPGEEGEVVLDLDGSRDRIFSDAHSRTQPIVLFLLRGGQGAASLEQCPSLYSIVRGSDPDPSKHSQLDPDIARESFREHTGKTPEDWLIQWRSDTLSFTEDNLDLAYQALLLERR